MSDNWNHLYFYRSGTQQLIGSSSSSFVPAVSDVIWLGARGEFKGYRVCHRGFMCLNLAEQALTSKAVLLWLQPIHFGDQGDITEQPPELPG